jgi:small subunit ribosomal protein S16
MLLQPVALLRRSLNRLQHSLTALINFFSNNLRRFLSMVRIRLRRTGLKGQPSYRVVVADKEAPRDGRFLEILGFYNPRTDPFTLDVKEDRVYDWMSKGAQPSDSVVKLFNSTGLTARFARFTAGEPAEALLAEAKTAADTRKPSSKTRKAA